MVFGRQTLLCLFFVTWVTGWSAARGEDWPQWGGHTGRNMISAEQGLPESFVPGKKAPGGGGIDPASTANVKWTARLGSYAYGNPTVAGGRVFVGTDDVTLGSDPRLDSRRAGMVKCFEEATGKPLWQLATPHRDGLPSGSLYSHQHLGTCSSPAVDVDRVYVVTSACEVMCLDVDGLADGNDGPFVDEAQYMAGSGRKPIELQPHDADVIWRFDMIDELSVCPHDATSGSPLVLGGMVYVNTSNGVDNPHAKVISPEAPSLIVLDQHTGRLVAVDDAKIGTRLYHCQWSSPSAGKVAGKTLIFLGGGDGVCYAFEAVGQPAEETLKLKTAWSFDCNPPEYKLRDGKPIPYYDGDKRKGRGNNDDGLYVGPSQIIATPVFSNDRVYIAIGQDPAHGRGRGMLHCIDSTGTGDITQTGKVWAYDGLDRSISTVAVADGLVYLPDIAGRLHCVDADTGECRWVHETKAETWGSTLIADGKIYLGTKRSFLTLSVGKEPHVLSDVYLGAPVYTTAVAANGVLYVASQRYLWAVEQTAAE